MDFIVCHWAKSLAFQAASDAGEGHRQRRDSGGVGIVLTPDRESVLLAARFVQKELFRAKD
jgi:hypothetical protein